MVDVVFVNWNSGSQLRDCLNSLRDSGEVEVVRQIIVVDNASTDGSMNGLPSELPITVLRNNTNCGFAAACNQGAAVGTSPFILFLNVDILLEEGSLRQPLAFLEAPENADVAVCGIQLTNRSGDVQPSVARFPTPLAMVGHALGLNRLGIQAFPKHFVGVGDLRTTRTVDQVMGAFFFVRREVFEALSGFDERFFVFYEELDFSLRVRQRGWRSVYLTTARAAHDTEAERSTPLRIYLSRRGRILYAHKHFPRLAATTVAVVSLTLEPVARLVRALFEKDIGAARTAVDAAGRLWSEFPLLFSGRGVGHPSGLSRTSVSPEQDCSSEAT